MNPLVPTALSRNLRADASTERVGGSAAPSSGAAFAGLLGGEQQRLASGSPGSSNTSGVYDGSAFDVAPARRDPPRPTTPPMADNHAKRACERPSGPTGPTSKETDAAMQARLDRQSAATRAPQAGAAGSRSTAAKAELASDAPREGDAAASRTEGPTASGGVSAADAADDGNPAQADAPDAQALLDFLTRWASPATAQPAGGPSGLPGQSGVAGDGPASVPGGGVPAVADGQGGGAKALESSADDSLVAASVGEAVAGLDATAALPATPPTTAGLTALPLSAPQALGGASAPAPVVVATPMASPDFSQALASQLVTLARDGVHEAQLQLNPVEMGPIAVQITIDGSLAQIDFAAAQARTREALEASWPALAASLHGAGLTLGGGGVFEQRPGERDADRGDAQGGSRSEPGPAGTEWPARAPAADARRGLLDLYA